ncbi:hypothetical protein [Rhabdothermincola salaria]|uniref:hypothetical protein n=1 Tax=Rhabdothermincola salaria TaxID=2903142 RepID=UPI001E3B2B1C|nr:hypothetical protein [Rhabdothermincola salaria]MCD9624579.1 hypothetical protein [Rhabdothermincola salaria]
MLRSRAFTPAFRFFAGLAVFSLVAAFVVGFSSEAQAPIDRVLGPLTMGWKGGVGNHVAYTLFVGLFGVSAGLAGILVAFRDADPEADAEVLRAESVPLTRAPAGMNYLPAIAAVAVVVALIGTSTANTGLALAAVATLVAVGLTWMLRAWAERATGDDTTNAELYHRFIDPLRLPIVSVVAIAIVVLGVSRVLLAVSKTGSVIVFSVIATVIFGITILLALVPKSGRYVVTGLVVAGALLVIAGGVIGAVAGERDFEHHGGEHGAEETGGATESGLAPLVVGPS